RLSAQAQQRNRAGEVISAEVGDDQVCTLDREDECSGAVDTELRQVETITRCRIGPGGEAVNHDFADIITHEVVYFASDVPSKFDVNVSVDFIGCAANQVGDILAGSQHELSARGIDEQLGSHAGYIQF